MKVVVAREALGDAVAFVARALPARPVVPLLAGMLVEASPGALTLSCFDYEVSARTVIDAEVAEPGIALVPGRLLAEITRSLPGRPVEFSDDGEAVDLRCGRAEFGLVTLALEEYPAQPRSPSPVGQVDGGALAAAIGQVAPAASRDDTLPMLTAVCLDISGQVMTLAATDRYRLAARELAFSPEEPDLRAVSLVPARIMVEATRMMKAGQPVTVAFDLAGEKAGVGGAGAAVGGAGAGVGVRRSRDEQPRPASGLISLESQDRRLTTRLIEGEFIKYRSRFPDEFGCCAEVPAMQVIEAVRRAALVAERAGPVRLSFQRDQLLVEAHAEGRARAAEAVPAVFSGDQPEISFNPHYLLDGLVAAAAGGGATTQGPAGAGPDSAANVDEVRVVDATDAEPAAADVVPSGVDGGPAEPDRIRLEFNSPAKPALITRADDAAFRYLVVPLRVQP